jgi:hypothetical protein
MCVRTDLKKTYTAPAASVVFIITNIIIIIIIIRYLVLYFACEIFLFLFTRAHFVIDLWAAKLTRK